MKFKTYRDDGTEVIGEATDLGLQKLGRRQLPWYVTEFDVDGKTFKSMVQARYIDGLPNSAEMRESQDVWTLAKHGFNHIELLV